MSTSTVRQAGLGAFPRKAARWMIAAAALFAARAAIFGPGLTPSLAALLGLDRTEALGPLAPTRIDVLDLALLGAIAGSLLIAMSIWVRRARR